MLKANLAAARSEQVSPAALAWLLLPPAVAVALPLTLLLAPWLGSLAFPRPEVHYWAEITAVRKPAVQAGYLLAIGWVVAYAIAIMAFARRRLTMPPAVVRTAVIVVQLLGAGLVAACWLAQRKLVSVGTTRVYFTSATVLVATLLTAAAVASLMLWRRRSASQDGSRAASRSARALAASCIAAAVVATCVWVLPAVYTDGGLRAAPEALFLGAWFLDESSAVLNGRSPLVNMVAYGNLWPYLVAIPLRAFGGTYAAFTVTMATLTGAGLLALFGMLLRVTRRAAFALVLYLPILATSFFIERGTLVARYSPGTYYGMFPLRYTGPCVLALLTAVYIGKDPRRRAITIALFTAAGLVTLNNLDFGGAALLGTAAAIALTRRPLDARALARLGGDVAVGLAASLVVVSSLTLIRAGTLPHLELLLRYSRIFVVGGNGNLPLPGLGLHIAITLTFVGTITTAAARAASGERDVVLTGMLAWTGAFGLGASTYYYAYRSHPDVLITLFPIWALALALLVVVVRESVVVGRRPLSLPAVAVLFGFALTACSIAQLPDPRSQVRRIEGHLEPGAPSYFPPDGFRGSDLGRLVAEETRPGEHVLLFSPMGHRVAHDVGVVDVSPYPGLGQMPAREQLHESLDMLKAEGGDKVFVSDRTPPELDEDMKRHGFRVVNFWRGLNGWPVTFLIEYQARRAGAASSR